MSNVVTVYPTSVNAIFSGKINIYGSHNAITVENAANDSVNIFTLDGHIVANARVSSDRQTFSVPASGVYVVIVDKKAYKVIVK
jgi:predicted GNAT family acetyltransferase